MLTDKIILELKKALHFPKKFIFRKKIQKKLMMFIYGLNIETTNICNANCTFCAYQHQKRNMGIMDKDLFEKIVFEYSSLGGGNLGLTPTVGEPLADKHILERIYCAKKYQNITSIGFYSNLISVQNFGVENIIKSGLTDLVVSTSGFDEEMYQRVYRSKQYKKMYKNLIDLIEINNKNNNPVNISISMRSDKNEKETRSSIDYIKLTKILSPKKIDYKYRYDDWAGKISKIDLTGNMKLRNKNLTFRFSPCSEFFSGPHIYWNGDVGICGCRDVDAKELIIGNVKEKKLEQIWYNQNHLTLMDDFMDSPKQICLKCSHYNNISVLDPDLPKARIASKI
jgi:radical SAM protein with 4Fe4S-binding SPASM domain